MGRENIHFVTGRLAEHALREQLDVLAPQVGFEYTIGVLGISVAALMTTPWVARKLKVPSGTTRVLLPGLCAGDLSLVRSAAGVDVARGPNDLRELAAFFGNERKLVDYGAYDIEIIAEINHAPRLPLGEILQLADQLRRDGADVIDVGCDPGDPWLQVGQAVRALKDAGHRVSIDSLHPREIELAARSGAELVLSVNSTNRECAADWGIEVVAIPDDPHELSTLESTLELLARRGVRHRIDPILEPIGFGFAASLSRYMEARRRWPAAEMMMGVGNLTELTDVDSAGVNLLLLAICQELGIRSVLTTQVINWARSCVRECDLARRLVHYAVTRRAPPKHVEPGLVMLRDPRVLKFGTAQLSDLAAQLKDPNFRIFAEDDEIHLMAAGVHLVDCDPFNLIARLLAQQPDALDAAHAFYLGYELSKAVTALTLGKQYRQDQSLNWGFLTRPEPAHGNRHRSGLAEPEDG
jgi:dihydropteroate synthase-like protein